MSRMRYGTGLLLLSLLWLGGCETERLLGPSSVLLPEEGPAPWPSGLSGARPQVLGDRWVAVVAWLQQVRQVLGAPYVAFVSWRDGSGRYRYRYVVLRVPRRWVEESDGRAQVYWFRLERGGERWREVLAWVPAHDRVLVALRRWVGRRGALSGGPLSGSVVVQGGDCEVSGGTSFMYVPSCDCYVMEAVVVVCSPGGGGGSWPPSQEDPRWWQQEGGLADCADLWGAPPRRGGGGGGRSSGSGRSEEACSEDALTCAERFPFWGKAVRLGKRLLELARKGEDLLDVETWKRLAREEWDELVSCGIDAVRVVGGDAGALFGVLDCAARLLVGVDFLEMVKGLKLADRLGFSACRELLGFIKQSRFASAFANRIDDLELLKD
ncbi:MAG: hypothetical protein Q9M35_13085 [Rhodothermus sp.]|nr:hypothetical protein [Rhodothermus sp.]